jgi:hypothetical protein
VSLSFGGAGVEMRKAVKRLADLQRLLARSAEENALPEDLTCLCVTAVAGQLHLDFFGTPSDEPFQEVLAAVVTPEVSTVLASLTLRGPDEGANGTRNWDLSRLADSGAVFPQLRAVSIEQTKPADHNRTIVAADYEEEGVLARLLARAPELESLVTPSAPNADFFRVDERPLKFLSVDAGYDTQDFIRNLARSSCFPDLRCLEFGEYNEKYMEDYAARCTPFADYQALFGAGAFRPVCRFVWRNPPCSAARIGQLKALRPDLQLLVVRTSAEYVE